MQYKLVHAELLSDLEKKVNELLSAGWMCYGSPFMKSRWICQPMMRGPR